MNTSFEKLSYITLILSFCNDAFGNKDYLFTEEYLIIKKKIVLVGNNRSAITFGILISIMVQLVSSQIYVKFVYL